MDTKEAGMRLFHVSEENDISIFQPRIPTRKDLDQKVGLVWAIADHRLSNFLTPRDCPRVGYHVGVNTTPEDRRKFFSGGRAVHGLAIEQGWLDRLRSTVLYLYEFSPEGFQLQDEAAGYYVARTAQKPVAKERIEDLLGELVRRQIELRVIDELWDLAQEVKASTLDWSLCRMRFARPKSENPEEDIL